MAKKDKPPATTEDALRTKHFLDLDRASGDQPGAKEMALTKKPRTAEKPEARSKHFLEIEKGKKV